MSIDATKKFKFSWFDFSCTFYNIKNITFICKTYSKSIQELLEFNNDLSITCLIYSTQVFDWYLCRIQSKESCFLFKKYLIPLGSLSKLYHKTDCHRFDEYKHKNPLRNYLGTATKLMVPRKTSLGRFSKNTLTDSEKRPVVAAIIHKNLTLIIIFTSKESLPTGNHLKHIWNTHFEHFPNTGSLK